MRSARLTILVLSLAVAYTAPLLAQDSSTVMQFNREGRWEEAATAAERILQEADTLGVRARCEVRSGLIYALARVRRQADAQTQMDQFDRQCAELPEDHWARREVDGLRPRTAQRAPTNNRPLATADDWRRGDPVVLGLDTIALSQHRSLCARSGSDACLVIHRGQIVEEWYGPHYREPMMAMSSTKSITGLLVGMLIADGKLSLDDPASRFIPEWRAGSEAGVTVRHLLTMTSGLPDNRSLSDVGQVSDKESFVFRLPLGARPGETWAYTNNGVFLLSPLLDRAAGEPIEDFAQRRLFGPLGMVSSRLHVYPEGQAWTHADMETTARDFARIGQMMLQSGRWNGVQIVPDNWVQASVRPSQALRPEYGLLWWLDVPGGYAARGYLNTNLYVLPAFDLVVVRMQAQPVADAVQYEPEGLRLFHRFVKP